MRSAPRFWNGNTEIFLFLLLSLWSSIEKLEWEEFRLGRGQRHQGGGYTGKNFVRLRYPTNSFPTFRALTGLSRLIPSFTPTSTSRFQPAAIMT